jgi:cellulose synthase/poly-beta-1,6-N-acetylglucosamine synthase-like glycosyltransferase
MNLGATLESIVQLLAWAFVMGNLGISVYGFVVGLRGFQPQKASRPSSITRRFAVVIPARNEALVLPLLLESLRAQNYPRDAFTVFVAADNCTDDTASVARACGATVLERFDEKRRGKSWTLKWTFSRLDLEKYESVIVFDADNLVHADFLARMNDYLEEHPNAAVVQGYLDVKNPDDSWITRASALSYWMTNRFWNRARANWGLANTLGGTGLLIRSSCLRELGWNVQSLTDDLEFSVQLILAGKEIHWNDRAITYDEKPATFAASYRQRRRWMQGHFWVLRRYGMTMLSRFVRTLEPSLWDAFLYLFNPVRVLTGLAFVVTQLVTGRFFESQGGQQIHYDQFAVSWLGALLANSTLQVVVAPWARFGKLNLKYLPDLFTWALFGLSWIPIQIVGWFKSGDQGNWAKTDHTRTIALQELEGVRD